MNTKTEKALAKFRLEMLESYRDSDGRSVSPRFGRNRNLNYLPAFDGDRNTGRDILDGLEFLTNSGLTVFQAKNELWERFESILNEPFCPGLVSARMQWLDDLHELAKTYRKA